MFFTSLEMHTMSQADVVSFLRPMLRKAWDAAVAMETEWLQHDADVVSTNMRIEQPDACFTRSNGNEASLPNEVAPLATPPSSNA